MKSWRMLTRRQAFLWLWRKDPEWKWGWLKAYLFSRADLKRCVWENLRDYGC